MKTQYFRIKKNLERIQEKNTPKRETLEQNDSPTYQRNQISQLITVLQSFVKSQSLSASDLEPRDKHPIIQLTNSRSNTISNKELEVWITTVCRTTFSTAFNYYYTDQLSYEQTRVFCAQTIIKNVLQLTEKYRLTTAQIKCLDYYIQNKILPYMLKKYPLTGETDVNKALENVVEEINSFDELENDFIYITKVKFAYRKSGNYNDLIMVALNKVLRATDESSGKLTEAGSKEELSNYKDFELTMSTIFQKVEDFRWMNKRSNDDYQKQEIKRELNMTQSSPHQDQKELDKYREQVKSYTSYLIGRKVSQNVDMFTQNEISNEHLVVKHSSILRILTKWCEELEGKFTKPNYMQQHLESIETLGGDINSLNDQHRENLDEKLQNQMISIREYLQKLRQSFFFEQSSQLLRHLEPDDYNFIQPYEKAFGKFSCQMVKDLHTFIIKYLNRLIHGLVKVAYDWHRESGYRNNYQKWSYPPNLVTFKIGDLIRCKCSSKQKEILGIFNELTRISMKNPEKLKIIRIKNRLRTQTNDILINVKFNNRLIGQIQLAVNTKKSKFAQYSNNFNHYLYELQRCIFGPFSQLTNIWRNIDIRSKQFEEIIRSEVKAEVGIEEIRQIQGSVICNPNTSSGHTYVNYQLPFRCSFCRNYHSHNDVIISNAHCTECKIFKCMRCQVQSMNLQELKVRIFGKMHEKLSKKVELASSKQLPSYGCFVQTDAKVPQIIFFKEYRVNGILHYLGKRDNKIYRVVTTHPTQIKNFFYHNIVFKIKDQNNDFFNLTNSEVKQQYLLPQYLQNIYRSQKQVLFLSQKKISNDKWPSIISKTKFPSSLLNIKKIEIANNDIKDIGFIADTFPNVQQIDFEMNEGCKLDPLTKLDKLRVINSQRNMMNEIPKSINNLKQLQQLNLYKNCITSLPEEVFQLKNLRILNLKYNNLNQLPQQLGNLSNLNELLLRGNNLQLIPDCIERLTSLTILNVGKCSLKTLNPKIGSLKRLKILDFVTNNILQIPDSFKNLTNLEKFKMQENKIAKLPSFISNFEKLVDFNIYANQVQEISIDFTKLSNLLTLNISNNRISRIDPSITTLSMLTEFYIHDNKYQKHSILAELASIEYLSLDVPQNGSVSCVPKEICSLNDLLTLKIRTTQNRLILTPLIKNLNQLQSLDLSKNGLVEIPKDIIYLISLQKLSMQDNRIEYFPVEYLKNLVKLQEINFRSNKFKKIDKELIEKLKVIDLSSNLLTEVEVPNTKNKNLKKLILSENLLTKVPANISYLKKLKLLDLSDNKIIKLQEDLIELGNMEYLSFHIYGNPIKQVNCGAFIESQMCEKSKNYINGLVNKFILRQFDTLPL